MKTRLFRVCIIMFLISSLSGCTFIFQKGRRSDMERIKELSRQLNDLERVKLLLEERLGSEISDKQVKLEMMQKGLVITVLGDVLFDSGKANIRKESLSILSKIATVLNENVPHLNIGIEGHTDNEPIRLSSWKSNWELSSARALSVLHYLVEERGISASRISAIAYGEYRPVASNEIKNGRQLNRRVEIVILPELTKVKEQEQSSSSRPREKIK